MCMTIISNVYYDVNLWQIEFEIFKIVETCLMFHEHIIHKIMTILVKIFASVWKLKKINVQVIMHGVRTIFVVLSRAFIAKRHSWAWMFTTNNYVWRVQSKSSNPQILKSQITNQLIDHKWIHITCLQLWYVWLHYIIKFKTMNFLHILFILLNGFIVIYSNILEKRKTKKYHNYITL